MNLSNLPSTRDWWIATRPILFLATAMIVLTLAGSFVSYENVVGQGHPWLPRTVCPGCPFCGMTRSFCALSSGRWQEAMRWNRGGPVLYLIGWLWLAVAGLIGSRYALRLIGKIQTPI